VTPPDDAAARRGRSARREGVDLNCRPLDLGKHIVLHAYLDKNKDDFPLDDRPGWRECAAQGEGAGRR